MYVINGIITETVPKDLFYWFGSRYPTLVLNVSVKGKRIIAIREMNRVMVIMVFNAKFNNIF
jgi:hypothetical protein